MNRIENQGQANLMKGLEAVATAPPHIREWALQVLVVVRNQLELDTKLGYDPQNAPENMHRAIYNCTAEALKKWTIEQVIEQLLPNMACEAYNKMGAMLTPLAEAGSDVPAALDFAIAHILEAINQQKKNEGNA